MIKGLLLVIIGAAVGASCGYYFGKKCGLEEAKKQYDLGMEWYKKRCEAYGTDATFDSKNEMNLDDSSDFIDDLTGKRFTRGDQNEPTDYSACYPADENGESSEDVEPTMTPEQYANDYHECHIHDEISAVPEEELGEVPGFYATETLLYYMLDGVLATEDNEEVIDPAVLVGNVLEETNWIDSDENIIYILNSHTDTIYEVQKVAGSYDDMMAGKE